MSKKSALKELIQSYFKKVSLILSFFIDIVMIMTTPTSDIASANLVLKLNVRNSFE